MAPNPKWARSYEEKTTPFAEDLAKVFTPNDMETDPEVEEQLTYIPADTPEIKNNHHKRSTKRNELSKSR
jgi:hypothetical protein